MSRPPQPRRADATSGARGEALAAAWLRRRGYRIAANNLRTVDAEIDLLVRRRRTWVAVEVKARTDHPAPERHVDGARLDRLSRALRALAPTLRPQPRTLRIDVVAVQWAACATGPASPQVRHFPGLRTWAYDPTGMRPSSRAGWHPADTGGYAGTPTEPAPRSNRLRDRLASALPQFLRRLLDRSVLTARRTGPKCRP